MNFKAYNKSIFREIKESKARFISILIIILLGVAFYSGIKASAPNMKKAVENFYNQHKLMDSKIVSTLGLTKDDLELLENNDKILEYYGSHTIDANLTNMNSVVRFMEYDKEKSENINSLYVVQGRLPENSGEIALDEEVTENGNFKIGDTYTVECNDDTEKLFKTTTFKIVGFVKSPLYIEKLSKGTTTVGKGTIDYFAVLNSNDFLMDSYSEIYVRFKNTEDVEAYSDEYIDIMEENLKYLKELFINRPNERVKEIKAIAVEKMMRNYAGVGIDQISQTMLEEQLSQFDEANYYFFDRNDNPGYSEFYDVVKRINSIATVFPIFFFIVAILICLTTMTRMVEENRIEIGTLKALGYSNKEISIKYIIYASFASIIGGILGIIIGFNLFPRIIYTAYSTQYSLPELSIIYYPSYIIQALIISILCTVGAALVVLNVDLNSTPSTLMRPKAPKVGKRILLERISPIWKRLNFNQKVTFRNLFRYKQRMIMTVFGIAACTAMIITGFGLKNSIEDLTGKQFNKLWKYQATVIFDENANSEADNEYIDILNSLEKYEGSLNVHQEIVTISKENINKQSVTLYVPESDKDLSNFILLNDRKSGQEYQLKNNGAIINEKLAKLLDVSVGDEISFTDGDNNSYTIKISNISESYLTHSIYMSTDYYKEIFKETPSYNSQFIKLYDDKYNEDSIASKLMECDKVINVTMTSYLAETTNNAMDTLNIVVIILIISAGGLALVVLYNLNNINVSERIRELSTIKVLGFYDHEVTMYILRENFILTALGILAGMFMGKVLHGFVIKTAEADNMMLSPNIYASSFIYSIILTLVFSFMVMIMMHRKLKKVNMIDALKSNE